MADSSAKTQKEKIELDEDCKTFEELSLDPRLLRALNQKGIVKPTPIQQVAIPLILVSIFFSQFPLFNFHLKFILY